MPLARLPEPGRSARADAGRLCARSALRGRRSSSPGAERRPPWFSQSFKKNLWPEPWPQAHKSDPRENAWKRKVCNGTLTLRQARAQELAYKRRYE
jgi:hypothetical protein